jgi:hypothetical protein
MFRRCWLVSTLVLVFGATAAPAETGMLDLIPQKAAGGLAVPNITAFKKQLNRFIADIDPNAPLQADLLFAMLYQSVGIQGGVDENNSAAVVLANPQAAGLKEVGPNFEQLMVVALAFTDRDKMAANFGFKEGELQPEKMASANGQRFARFLYVRGKHLFFGKNEKAVASVAQGKPLGAELAADRRKALAKADLLGHVGPGAWTQEWTKILKDLETSLDRNADKEEREVVRQFLQGMAHVKHGFAAVHLEGGLGVSFLAIFPKEGNPAARQFLKGLAGSGGPARLTGLPHGNVLAALGAGGAGDRNALITKVFLNALLQNTPAKKVFSRADRPTFVGLFTEVWQRLRGSRAAVYQNLEEQKLGLFSVVAILDTEDPVKFIADMRELAHIADGKALDLSTQTGRDTEGPKIEALVRDLGDRRFRVRQSATTKLRLLGEPGLPYLARAMKSGDLEVAMRARQLSAEIEQAASQRRKELLKKDLPRLVKPTFAFVAKAEQRGGSRIDVVTVKLADRDVAAVPQFKQLFGPDWDKIRLAVHGKQVVALLGSDVRLLEDTLANLKGGKPGLAGWKVLAPFDRQRHPARRYEAHLSLQRALALVMGTPKGQPAKQEPALTSWALTVEPDHVQVDLRLNSTDLKAITQANRRP